MFRYFQDERDWIFQDKQDWIFGEPRLEEWTDRRTGRQARENYIHNL